MGLIVLDPARLSGVVLDMDGVVTDTARVHLAAWRDLFDGYLRHRSGRTGEPFAPFTDEDYLRYVDGRRREDGVAAFLASRGVLLPDGDPDDGPDAETVTGLGRRKNDAFLAAVARDGVDAYPSTLRLLRALREADLRVAVITASRNAGPVLAAAGAADLFDARVDGEVAASLGLPGKPAPDVFLEAARRLGVPPERAAVVEDALAGVRAGRAGGFALVVGVDRTARPGAPGPSPHAQELRDAGADVVVTDLSEVTVASATDATVALATEVTVASATDATVAPATEGGVAPPTEEPR